MEVWGKQVPPVCSGAAGEDQLMTFVWLTHAPRQRCAEADAMVVGMKLDQRMWGIQRCPVLQVRTIARTHQIRPFPGH